MTSKLTKHYLITAFVILAVLSNIAFISFIGHAIVWLAAFITLAVAIVITVMPEKFDSFVEQARAEGKLTAPIPANHSAVTVFLVSITLIAISSPVTLSIYLASSLLYHFWVQDALFNTRP